MTTRTGQIFQKQQIDGNEKEGQWGKLFLYEEFASLPLDFLVWKLASVTRFWISCLVFFSLRKKTKGEIVSNI